MNRRTFLSSCLLVPAAAAVVRAQRPAGPLVDVYKDPTCGCCSLWVEHLKKAGFTTKVTESSSLDGFKTKHGIPQRARSCHTALVGGYVLEGHVPAKEVQRLLAEKPSVLGLAVPGMPIGSPGMEVTGMKPQAYDVVSFDKQGAMKVFASYNR